MFLSKINTVLHNPEVISIMLKTNNSHKVRQYLSIKKNRLLMTKICDEIDYLILQNKTIKDIVETVSTKFNFIKYPIIWYSLIRKYHLKIIVETGVSMGWSSFMILTALAREHSGILYSIDINSDALQNEGGVGYLVPDHLKKNWNLVLGDTNKYLEPTLNKIKTIDMFIHDSDHSYQTMFFEFQLAWDFLKKDGFLCSDDINHNNAFTEFLSKHTNEYTNHHTFNEIQRPSDATNKRPMIGFLQKIT